MPPKLGNDSPPPPTAPTALIFGICSTLPAVRPATTQLPRVDGASPGTPDSLAGTSGLGTRGPFREKFCVSGEELTSLDHQLAQLRARHRRRAEEFDHPAPKRSLNGVSPPVTTKVGPPRLSVSTPRGGAAAPLDAFPAPQNPSAVGTPSDEDALPEEEAPVSTPAKRTVAVSQATLKRRQQKELQEKKAAEAQEGPSTSATAAGAGASPARPRPSGRDAAPWRKNVGPSAPLPPETAPPPPPVADRLRRIDEIVLLLQAKGPVATEMIRNAMNQDGGGGQKGKKGGNDANALSPTAAHEWVCHEAGMQALKTEVLDRWLPLDSDSVMARAVRLNGLVRPLPSTPPAASPARPARRGLAATQQLLAASASAAGFFDGNALLKGFRGDVMQRPVTPPPNASEPQKVPPEGFLINAAGATLYVPTDREVQAVLAATTPIVRTLLQCSENGRSTVSRIAVELLGVLGDTAGVTRLGGYYPSRDNTPEQLQALMCSPLSRALDTHADAIIGKLIAKGGTAAVKFFFDVAAVALFSFLRGVNGSGNKILIGTLLQGLGANPPKTEKSRVLWGDSIALAIFQRWVMSYVAPLLSPSTSTTPTSTRAWLERVGGAGVLSTTWIAMCEQRGAEEAGNGLLARLRHASADEPLDHPPHAPHGGLTLTTSAKDIRELLAKGLPVIDALIGDGSPDVREAGKRALLALTLLVEEFSAVAGGASGGPVSPASSPSKAGPPASLLLAPSGGLAAAMIGGGSLTARGPLGGAPLSADVSPAREAVPTSIDAAVTRMFADSKAKLNRMRDAVTVARATYADTLCPALLAHRTQPTTAHRVPSAPPSAPPARRSPQVAATRAAAAPSPATSVSLPPPPDAMDQSATMSPTDLDHIIVPSTQTPVAKAQRTGGRPKTDTKSATPSAPLLTVEAPSDRRSPTPNRGGQPAEPPQPPRLGTESDELLLQLHLFVLSSSSTSSSGEATQRFRAAAATVSDADVLQAVGTLKAASLQKARGWGLEDGNPIHAAAALLSSPETTPLAAEMALAWLMRRLSDEGALHEAVPPPVAAALLEGLLPKVTSPNHRLQGQALMLALVLLGGRGGPLVPAAAAAPLCGRAISCLTTTMNSSSHTVAAAAEEALRLVIRASTASGKGAGGALNDLVSTAFATSSAMARTALLTIAAQEVAARQPALAAAEVRFPAEMCARIIASISREAQAEEAKGSLTAAGAICAAAIRLLHNLFATGAADTVAAAWRESGGPALLEAVRGDDAGSDYEDDFERSRGEVPAARIADAVASAIAAADCVVPKTAKAAASVTSPQTYVEYVESLIFPLA